MFRFRLPLLFFALLLLTGILSVASAEPEPTATPEPVQISGRLSEPPAEIQKMIEIALEEWRNIDGKALPSAISIQSG